MERIVIAGGTGFMGKNLTEYFLSKNAEVVVLTRQIPSSASKVKYVQWDGKTLENWTKEIEGSDVLINLTGKSVDCRYTDENKRIILSSRVDSTRVLGKAVENSAAPPKVWINASTATIYRHSEDKIMTEENGEMGDDFSMNIAKAWEAAFYESETPRTRKVALRTSLVVGANGGVYPVLRRLAKFRMAGAMGSGNQRFAWIHIEDVIRMVSHIIRNEELEGPINCTAPICPTNREFLKALRQSLGINFGIPQPKLLLSLGGMLIGTESELVLKSRWVAPQKMIESGFVFKYKTHEKALRELAKNVR
ncbi:MAG: TIGR01777 family oxidoreductase [Crocinitomicaceae bacterium]|nr:TIGR01777 family oxidoreductase [Crocinitomicaceae bacterium]